ncbi:hypothetical protein VNO80_10221 [Phaseolus coccineus]|uniref:Uncharacterized protein n=1 Tax=Phaseolus coccineus TaxID=3886 RepID=A0AAN9ND10_PHACN
MSLAPWRCPHASRPGDVPVSLPTSQLSHIACALWPSSLLLRIHPRSSLSRHTLESHAGDLFPKCLPEALPTRPHNTPSRTLHSTNLLAGILNQNIVRSHDLILCENGTKHPF